MPPSGQMCMMHKAFAIEKTKEGSKALFMVSENQLSCDPDMNHTTYLNCQSRFYTHFQNILINISEAFSNERKMLSMPTTTLDTKVSLMLIKLMSMNFQ